MFRMLDCIADSIGLSLIETHQFQAHWLGRRAEFRPGRASPLLNVLMNMSGL